MQILDFLERNNNPKNKEIIENIARTVGDSHERELQYQMKDRLQLDGVRVPLNGLIEIVKIENNKEYIRKEKTKYENTIRLYSQNFNKNRKFIDEYGYSRGDVEVIRKQGIWYFCSLYKIYSARLCHIHGLETGDYLGVDEKALTNSEENKPIFWRFRYVIERYNDNKEIYYFYKSKRKRKRRYKTSLYLAAILGELAFAGANGITINEMHKLLKQRFPKITKHAIWRQLNQLGDNISFSYDPSTRGPKPKRYYLTCMQPEDVEKILCEDCDFFIAHSIKVTDEGPKSICREKSKGDNIVKRLKTDRACVKFEPRTRKYHPFKDFKRDEEDRILCPVCRETETLRIPKLNTMYICNNCETLVRYKSGGFVYYKGAYIPSDRITKYYGIYSVRLYGDKRLIYLGEGKRLKVIRGKDFNLHILKVNGRSYYSFEVNRIILANGKFWEEDIEFLKTQFIKILKLDESAIKKEQERAQKAGKLRKEILKARRDGRAFTIVWEMQTRRIQSDMIYTLELLNHGETPKIINDLVLQELDCAVSSYLLKAKTLQEFEGNSEEKLLEVVDKLRGIEGNCEDITLTGIKRALPPEDTFSSRVKDRHAPGISFYGSRALDRFNTALNYFYFHLGGFGGDALGNHDFSKYWPGRGFYHHRSVVGKEIKSVEVSENRELIYDFIDHYRIPFLFELLLMFRNNELDEKDIEWREGEWRDRVFYIVGGESHKLDVKFAKILSQKYIYDNRKLPLSEIMNHEAKSLRDYLLDGTEYKAFVAFQEEHEMQHILYRFDLINEIIKPGRVPEKEIVKDEELLEEWYRKYRRLGYEKDRDGYIIKLSFNNLFLKEIPEGLEVFQRLRSLELSQNQISKIERLEKLVKLYRPHND